MTREDEWLAAINGALTGESPMPEVPGVPVWHYEEMLAAIYEALCGVFDPKPFPARTWRLDEFLYAVYCAVNGDTSVEPPEPTCRIEEFWCGIYKALTGDETYLVPVPAWRIEELLKALYDAAVAWGATEQTLTGSVVSFVGKATTKITGLTSAIVPVQSGSGTPSPSNPRPITGFAGATIRVSPTEDPDDATTYAVDWTDEAGTVYGGTLGLVTGVLTVDRAMDTINGTQNLVDNGVQAYGGIACVYTPTRAKKRAPSVSTQNEGLLSNLFDTSHAYADGACAVTGRSTNGYIYFNMPVDITTVADAKTWFASHPTQISYLLETPLTYQLAAADVQALVGDNYVWSDFGDVTVTVKGAVSP